MPGSDLIANVVISKYFDGLSLYRQPAILVGESIKIERATLADWVGHAGLVAAGANVGAHVIAAPVIHTDDTPIAVLAPGNGKTRTGWIWIYRSTSGHGKQCAPRPPIIDLPPDRKGERPRDHLATFRDVHQGNSLSDYEALARQVGPPGVNVPPIMHTAYWAEQLKIPHTKYVKAAEMRARRKLFDKFEQTKSPIAEAAL